jgi:hypothetical protein
MLDIISTEQVAKCFEEYCRINITGQFLGYIAQRHFLKRDDITDIYKFITLKCPITENKIITDEQVLYALMILCTDNEQ